MLASSDGHGRGSRIRGARRLRPARPRFHPLRVVVSWLLSAVSLLVAALLVPHVHVNGLGGAIIASLAIAILNAIVPPLIAALRLPFMALLGFVLVLVRTR